MDIYFCGPHSLWQHGSNEIDNDLLREYLPKGMDFSTITQRGPRPIKDALSNHPRKVLGFRTASEVFSVHQPTNTLVAALQALTRL